MAGSASIEYLVDLGDGAQVELCHQEGLPTVMFGFKILSGFHHMGAPLGIDSLKKLRDALNRSINILAHDLASDGI